MNSERPNILWYCADQMRSDTIAALGNPVIHTPRLDQLVQSGVAFENCYVQNQLCTPSRASFLTGRYPAAHQTYRNGNAFFPPGEKLVSKMLAEAGYECGLVGKLYLSSAGGASETRPDDGYRVFNWSQNPGKQVAPGVNQYWQWLTDVKGVDPRTWFPGPRPYLCEGPPAELSQSAWCAQMAIQFINQNRQGPWMLSVNPFDPHPHFDPPPEYAKRYKPADMPPPLFRQSDIARQHQFSRVRSQMMEASNPVLTEAEKKTFAPTGGDLNGATPPVRFDGLAVKAAYYAMIENLDDKFGRIIDHLRSTGQLENTLVIFSSDHGELLGDHGLLYKGCKFFEGLVHVPLIISWPGTYDAGLKSNALVESIDIAPTLLDAAGIVIPHYVQGQSLHRLLTGEKDPGHHKDLVITDFNDSLGTSPIDDDTQASMTFDGRYKLVVYHSHRGLGELYDLREDPGEFVNLWQDATHRDLRSDLLARHLNAMMKTIPPGPLRIAKA